MQGWENADVPTLNQMVEKLYLFYANLTFESLKNLHFNLPDVITDLYQLYCEIKESVSENDGFWGNTVNNKRFFTKIL